MIIGIDYYKWGLAKSVLWYINGKLFAVYIQAIQTVPRNNYLIIGIEYYKWGLAKSVLGIHEWKIVCSVYTAYCILRYACYGWGSPANRH